jgi:hypothetical protein
MDEHNPAIGGGDPEYAKAILESLKMQGSDQISEEERIL